MSPPSSRFPFCSLPPELRFQIYRHLLTHITCYRPFSDLDFIPRVESGFKTSILRVNKAIHSEATAILWGENIWHLDLHYSFEFFLNQDTSSNRFLLREHHLYRHLKRFNVKFVLQGIMLAYYPDLTLQAYVQATYEHALKKFVRFEGIEGLQIEISWLDDTGLGQWERKRKVLEALRVLPTDARWSVGCVMSDHLLEKRVFEEFLRKIMAERGRKVEVKDGGGAELVDDLVKIIEKTAPFF